MPYVPEPGTRYLVVPVPYGTVPGTTYEYHVHVLYLNVNVN